MKKVFNKDGFNWFVGVVEDRDDPLKVGRCKVRVYGYHTENRKDLPTKDLPWAVPIMPITSAGTSGIGSSPHGLVNGSWVVGFFLDGHDMQQPAIFGSLCTFTPEVNFKPERVEEILNETETSVNTFSGLFDERGNKVFVGRKHVSGYKLGITGSQLVDRNNERLIVSPSFISDYKTSEDFRGARYGKYKLISFLPEKTPSGSYRASLKYSTLQSYLNQSAFLFGNFTPGTDDFDREWTNTNNNNTSFESDQDLFARKRFLEGPLNSMKGQGIRLDHFGIAVKELVFNNALLFGVDSHKTTMVPILNKVNKLNESDVIEAVTSYRIQKFSDIFAYLDSTEKAITLETLIKERDLLIGLLS